MNNVISGPEMDLGLFDWLLDKPDVKSLINELGLVPGPMPPDWIIHCKTPKFCDVYKRFVALKDKERAQLCRELYLRNKSRSRYVHRSYTD